MLNLSSQHFIYVQIELQMMWIVLSSIHLRAQQLLLVRLQRMALEEKDFKKKVVRLLILPWHEQQAHFKSPRLSKLLRNHEKHIYSIFPPFACSS